MGQREIRRIIFCTGGLPQMINAPFLTMQLRYCQVKQLEYKSKGKNKQVSEKDSRFWECEAPAEHLLRNGSSGDSPSQKLKNIIETCL